MDLLILGAIVLLGLFLLAAIGVGLFWFLRQRSQESAPQQKKKPKKKPKKKAAKPAPSARKDSPPPAKKEPPAPAAADQPPSAPPKPLDIKVEPGDKVRILVVDDNPDTRDHVSRLLYFEKDMEVIGHAVNGREGIEMAIKLKPHIVLMDINMPDMDGITATQEMTLKAPYSQVIVMSVQSEQHYMRQAMAAGARDFQPKPFTSEELVSCVRRVYNIGLPVYQQLESAEQTQGESQPAASPTTETPRPVATDTPVFVVYSPKGGIGTSVMAANIAIALQQTQGDIVLMDGDLQFGDIAVHLNIRAQRTMNDMIHEDGLEVELLPDVVLSHNSGLKLLLAPTRPELAEALTPAIMEEIIRGLRQHFKGVVIDTHATPLDDIVLTILDQADYILLVAGPELPALKNAKLFLETAELLNLDRNRIRVVVNRATLPGAISPQQIEKVLKLDRAYYVPYDPRVFLATNKGISILQQEPNAPASQAMKAVATDLWQILNNAE